MTVRRLAVERSEKASLGMTAILLVLLVACAQPHDAIRLDGRMEGALAGGQSRSYMFPCEADQFVDLVVDQRGIDVVATLKGPDGAILADVDGLLGASGKELLLGLTSTPGDCTLELRSLDETSREGKYVVWIEQLRVAEDSDHRRVEAARVYSEAVQLDLTGNLDAALAEYGKALTVWTDLGDSRWQGLVHYTLGQLHANKLDSGEPSPSADRNLTLMMTRPDMPVRRYGESEAILHLNESLRFSADMPGIQARAYLTLGDIHREFYRLDFAHDNYLKAHDIWRQFGDKYTEATVLNNLGLVNKNIGDHQKAINNYSDAIKIWREIGNDAEEANSLHNRGQCYIVLNRPEMAFADLEKALETWTRLEMDRMAASSMIALGSLLTRTGSPDAAYEHLVRALEIHAPNRLWTAFTKLQIGMVYAAQGEKQDALDLFRELVDEFRELGSPRHEAIALLKIGELLEEADPDQAFENQDQAKQLAVRVGNRDLEATALFGMARAQRSRGLVDSALRLAEEGLNKIENLRRPTAGFDLQSVYFAGKQDFYTFYIDLLIDFHQVNPGEKYQEIALVANERSRSRSLMDMLSDSGVDLRSGRSSGLLEQEAELEREIESAYLRREVLLSSRDTTPEVGTLNDELREKILELDELRNRIREDEPIYAELTQPRHISSETIQQYILDDDTVLLEYRLAEPRSFLFAVDKEKVHAFELPGSKSLTDQARRLHNILTDAPEKITLNRSRLHATLSNLSIELLAPAIEILNKKRILIVAEGALQYVPFSALKHPVQPSDDGDVRLIDRHEIVLVPSAWTLGIMRERFADRRSLAPRKVAVLADPVFYDDPRVPVSASRTASMASMSSDIGPRLGRLMYSRYEAENIVDQADDDESMKALGFDATKSAALDEDLRHYQYVHFATHSVIDTNFPEMSSLVFSRWDRKGKEIDAFMRIYDVYKLDLQAELVALSACRTAKGKEIRGEGLVGWTHGFMVAGAERVLVSLWDVDDESTSELMKIFYSKVFKHEHSPASALRQAQVEIREQSRWSSPYFWAGFVLQGEFL